MAHDPDQRPGSAGELVPTTTEGATGQSEAAPAAAGRAPAPDAVVRSFYERSARDDFQVRGRSPDPAFARS
ncbi:MAG: hypothetical protein H0V03_03840 [Thermoleophilaceae bacterium]|nr:hypothetical protein [Thermoleophilaceae bacterium]